MNEKWWRRTITLLAVGTFVLLIFPIFSITIDNTQYVIRGINLSEFSGWGCVLIIIPLLILELLYSHMNFAYKTMGIIYIECVNLFGAYESFEKAKLWIENLSGTYIRPEPYLFAYAAMVTLTLIIFYFYNEYSGTNFLFKKEKNQHC